jgi:chalcone synthase
MAPPAGNCAAASLHNGDDGTLGGQDDANVVVQGGAVAEHTISCLRGRQAAEGVATVLAIATAVPPTEFLQSEYPDFLFRVCNCDAKIALKDKFRRICEKTEIRKRNIFLTEEVLKANPSICFPDAGHSLRDRQEVAGVQVPKLAQEAAVKAIKEWGRPKSDITHVVFGTTCGIHMPGADLQFSKLMGLETTVKRVMMYQIGCSGGAAVVRVAKDLAENNKGARVLVVCSEGTALGFVPPNESKPEELVETALFGDGAACVIVGADPIPKVERSLFELLWAGECFVPETDKAVYGNFTEVGMEFHLTRKVPFLISENIAKLLDQARKIVNNPNWNDMFWAIHGGGPAILKKIETALQLAPHKLAATREVLREYGNVYSGSCLFALDQIRLRSLAMDASTTGESCEYGFLCAFGPGVTIDALLLRSVPTITNYFADDKENYTPNAVLP